MAPVIKAFKNGNQVQVLKTLKANGENFQISFCDLVKSWVISSKNVALLARNREDIKFYEGGGQTDDRFHFARLMADAWFSKLESMPLK